MTGKRTKRTPEKPRKPRKRNASAAKAESVALTIATDEEAALKARALDAFRVAGTVSGGCDAIGLHRQRWYEWLERDPAFARQAMQAVDVVTDDLESEAITRAKKGSDMLLAFLLKARRYRDTMKIDLVSPDVRERVDKTVAAIVRMVPHEYAEPLLKHLHADVW